jgi:hypothetical protein
MTRLPLIVALVGIIGCESDETKLNRLKLAQEEACLPVHLRDSAEAEDKAAVPRAVAGASSLAQSAADLQAAGEPQAAANMQAAADLQKIVALEGIRARLANAREITDNPQRYHEKREAERKEQTACELATRDLNRFMR